MSIIQLNRSFFIENNLEIAIFRKNERFDQNSKEFSSFYENRGPFRSSLWTPLSFLALNPLFFLTFFFGLLFFLPEFELAILSLSPPGAFPDSSNCASNSSWYSCATLALWDCSLPDATLPCSWTHSSTLSVSWHTKLLTLAQFSSFQKNPPRDFT